jgi:hypothetical protein
MCYSEPEMPEWVIELQLFEDNVKLAYARLKKHIHEAEERLETKRNAIRVARPDVSDVRAFEVDEALCAGLNRAMQHLIDAMGTAEAFEDDYWDENCWNIHATGPDRGIKPE